jgi:hypothetical protein
MPPKTADPIAVEPGLGVDSAAGTPPPTAKIASKHLKAEHRHGNAEHSGTDQEGDVQKEHV